jgi:hypothetical protein
MKQTLQHAIDSMSLLPGRLETLIKVHLKDTLAGSVAILPLQQLLKLHPMRVVWCLHSWSTSAWLCWFPLILSLACMHACSCNLPCAFPSVFLINFLFTLIC